MNKIIVLALSFIFIISIGCASEDSSSNMNTSSENQSKPSLAPNLNEKSQPSTNKQGEKKSGGILQVKNNDPDTLHNPHGYSVKGASRKTLFNKPLPSQGDIAEVTKNIARLKQKKDKHFFLQCDQHNWMEADARIVWNPYYSVTGADGAFSIDGVPAGKYKVTAWQPYVGESTQEVTVGDGAAKADFTLTAK